MSSKHCKGQTAPSSGHSPSGGCSMSPFLSQVPMGWMSDESTNLQKSLVLSLPSRRRRRRVPIMPMTVAMHTELELRGSRASSFMPALKSLEGGTLDCTQTEAADERMELGRAIVQKELGGKCWIHESLLVWSRVVGLVAEDVTVTLEPLVFVCLLIFYVDTSMKANVSMLTSTKVFSVNIHIGESNC